ncbi:substrate-binding domain-containing protein [Nonomuraea sp. NPDC049269]|uniref:substrate-binding domain-containing protein n=1 Tax=Nonomuraea sp. NPDC049269 TaxID=3364349 RepID=UPI003716254C
MGQSFSEATARWRRPRSASVAFRACPGDITSGALQALWEAGRRVLDDVALVGFEDLPIARHTNPPLTSLRQPTEEMGVVHARPGVVLPPV